MLKALWRAFADGLVDNDEKEVSSKKKARKECKNHTLFESKMTKFDTLFVTKTANKP